MAPTVKRVYLLGYNAAQAAGWGVIAFALVKTMTALGGDVDATRVLRAVTLLQLVQLMEVAHAAIGLTGGSPVTALAQVGGRLHALYAFWLVAGIRPDRAAIMPALVMAGAWTVAELVRYPHYIASQLVALTGRSATPRWLEWLRYSAFIPLYPIGLIGEMLVLRNVYTHAAGPSAADAISLRLPNSINFAFEYTSFCRILVYSYVPIALSPIGPFAYMLKQRSRRLQTSPREMKRE